MTKLYDINHLIKMVPLMTNDERHKFHEMASKQFCSMISKFEFEDYANDIYFELLKREKEDLK